MFPAEASKLVPSFVIYAPNGEQAGQAAGAAGAILSGYTLPSTGAYIIYVRAYQGQSRGRYTLTVGEGATLRHVGGRHITGDVAVLGNLPRAADREVWSIDLPANATLRVETFQSRFDPLIEVVGPDGKIANRQGSAPTHAAGSWL
jgi:hypothetical protein